MSRKVTLSTVLVGTRPDLAAPNKGRDGRRWPFLGKEVHCWPTGGESAASQQHDGGRVVEIGANWQSCDPPTTLLFKLVLDVVFGGLVIGQEHKDCHSLRCPGRRLPNA